MRTLTLIIPDLLANLAAADELGQSLPTLKQLSHSSAKQTESYEDEATAFFRWMGGKGPLPAAQLLALHYQLPPAQEWLIAQPIECQADEKAIYCLGTAHLQVTQAEANALVESLNHHLIPGGMRLYAPEPDRWLLSLAQPLKVETQSLNTVVNRALSQTPSLFTELQMLLHQHPINREREATGRPLIHACWLSGEGKLSPMNKQPRAGVICKDPLTRVLARWIEAQICEPLSDLESAFMQYSEELTDLVICLKANQHALALEQNLISALQTDQWMKRIEKLQVYGGGNLCYDAPKQWMKKKLSFL